MTLRRKVSTHRYEEVSRTPHLDSLSFFFSDVCRLPDRPVHSIALLSLSITLAQTVPVYDMVERDGVVCDVWQTVVA